MSKRRKWRSRENGEGGEGNGREDMGRRRGIKGEGGEEEWVTKKKRERENI